jgi:putative transposase
MPRRPRAEFEGAIHHVFARGAARQDVFVDDADRRRYLELLDRTVSWLSWRCLTYCLMSNHMHLLIETPKPNLQHGMQRFHGEYAQRFNRRHTRSGHVFQGRYKAVPVESDAQLFAAVRYIVNNPVEAGLCDAPETWPWSSHGATLAGTAPRWLDTGRLLSYVAAYGGSPRSQYAELVKGSGPLSCAIPAWRPDDIDQSRSRE